eukprot:g12270.t1
MENTGYGVKIDENHVVPGEVAGSALTDAYGSETLMKPLSLLDKEHFYALAEGTFRFVPKCGQDCKVEQCLRDIRCSRPKGHPGHCKKNRVLPGDPVIDGDKCPRDPLCIRKRGHPGHCKIREGETKGGDAYILLNLAKGMKKTETEKKKKERANRKLQKQLKREARRRQLEAFQSIGMGVGLMTNGNINGLGMPGMRLGAGVGDTVGMSAMVGNGVAGFPSTPRESAYQSMLNGYNLSQHLQSTSRTSPSQPVMSRGGLMLQNNTMMGMGVGGIVPSTATTMMGMGNASSANTTMMNVYNPILTGGGAMCHPLQSQQNNNRANNFSSLMNQNQNQSFRGGEMESYNVSLDEKKRLQQRKKQRKARNEQAKNCTEIVMDKEENSNDGCKSSYSSLPSLDVLRARASELSLDISKHGRKKYKIIEMIQKAEKWMEDNPGKAFPLENEPDSEEANELVEDKNKDDGVALVQENKLSKKRQEKKSNKKRPLHSSSPLNSSNQKKKKKRKKEAMEASQESLAQSSKFAEWSEPPLTNGRMRKKAVQRKGAWADDMTVRVSLKDVRASLMDSTFTKFCGPPNIPKPRFGSFAKKMTQNSQEDAAAALLSMVV